MAAGVSGGKLGAGRSESAHRKRRTGLENALMEPAVQAPSKPRPHELRTLAIDIGGTGIKAVVLSTTGKPLTERSRVKTPRPATLGTGFGSGLFVDGILVPNLELGHHPFQKGKTYEELLGDAVLKKVGKKKWNKRLVRAIRTLDLVFNYDLLYIGGGNAERVTVKLPENVKIVSNVAGLLGGLALWRD